MLTASRTRTGWFILHLAGYLLLLAAAWVILAILDQSGLFPTGPNEHDYGAALGELVGYYWFVVLLAGLPTGVALLVLLAVGKWLRGWTFRPTTILLMLVGGILVIFIPSVTVYAIQFLTQLLFGFAVRRPPMQTSSSPAGQGKVS